MALSDKYGRAYEGGKFLRLDSELTPLGQGGGSVMFENAAAVEMSFVVEMVVYRDEG